MSYTSKNNLYSDIFYNISLYKIFLYITIIYRLMIKKLIENDQKIDRKRGPFWVQKRSFFRSKIDDKK